MTPQIASFLAGRDLPYFTPAAPIMAHKPARHFPVLFLSDLHLGSRSCKEDALLDFLQSHTADLIYLVGDIVDTWVASADQWTTKQQVILQNLLDRVRDGTRLVFTPGNHDALFRQYVGQTIAGVEVVPQIIHRAADGRRYLVIHGDGCDIFGDRFPVLERIGAWSELATRLVSDHLDRWLSGRARAPLKLADTILHWANDLIRGLDRFEVRLADLARREGTDGIICGHFHKPALQDQDGVAYANCGDWVENTTALVETASGRLMLLDWTAAWQEASPQAGRQRHGLPA